ncbi:MAG: hypothetical protein Q4C87_07960 [Actinomycetaceae bacterium]|nr:hypothetical protein [Actinomycetaceae bacterium]
MTWWAIPLMLLVLGITVTIWHRFSARGQLDRKISEEPDPATRAELLEIQRQMNSTPFGY